MKTAKGIGCSYKLTMSKGSECGNKGYLCSECYKSHNDLVRAVDNGEYRFGIPVVINERCCYTLFFSEVELGLSSTTEQPSPRSEGAMALPTLPLGDGTCNNLEDLQ